MPQSSDRDTTVTEYRFVIVAYNGRAAYGESLGEALAKLFPGFEEDLGDRVGAAEEPEDGETPPPETGETVGEHAGRAAGRRPTSCSPTPTWRWRPATSPATRRTSRRPRSLIDQALDLLDRERRVISERA